MKPVDLLTETMIRDCLRYEPESGKIYWKKRPSPNSSVREGRIAGSQGTKGYRRFFINGREIQVHQAVWFFERGSWPTSHIDHIDGVRSNNVITNLRLVDFAENAMNRAGRTSTGYKGVYRTKSKTSPWKASIYYNGASRHIGYFRSEVAAAKAYDAAALLFFGEFARLNFPEEIAA